MDIMTGMELVIFGGGRLAGDGAADDLQMEQQRDENLVELAMAMVPLAARELERREARQGKAREYYLSDP